eukprot:3104002-Prymnesium_polylepis.1
MRSIDTNLVQRHPHHRRVELLRDMPRGEEQCSDVWSELLGSVAWVNCIEEIARARRNAHNASPKAKLLKERVRGSPLLQQRRRHQEVVGPAVRAYLREGAHSANIHEAEWLSSKDVQNSQQQPQQPVCSQEQTTRAADRSNVMSPCLMPSVGRLGHHVDHHCAGSDDAHCRVG